VSSPHWNVCPDITSSVLVSSPQWNLCPDITSCLNVIVLSLWGVPSDERSGLSPVSHCQRYLVHCQNFILFTFYMSHMFYVYSVYTRPLSAQAQYNRSCPFICSLSYNSSLVPWKVVRLTAAKFKPLIFSVLGFVLSCIADLGKFKSQSHVRTYAQSVCLDVVVCCCWRLLLSLWGALSDERSSLSNVSQSLHF
jgi:hypothetical protein